MPKDRQAIGEVVPKSLSQDGHGNSHAHKPSTWEAEVQGLPQILGQPGLLSKTSPQKERKNTIPTLFQVTIQRII